MSINTKGLIVEIITEHRPIIRGHELLETRSPLITDVLTSEESRRLARRWCPTYGYNEIRVTSLDRFGTPEPFAWFNA